MRVVIAGAVLFALALVTLVVLRLGRWVMVYDVPAAGMAPTIEKGDKILMTGFKKVQRGDVIVFVTDDIPYLTRPGSPPTTYVKRLVGLPGEKLRLTDGSLYVNGERIELTNKNGPIRYSHFQFGARYLVDDTEIVTVPDDAYFVLGDNTGQSADSRFFGFVPMKSVLGRAVSCYWPPAHAGPLR